MIKADVYNAALERFSGEVEALIDSRGLARYKGTSTLDEVQKEINTVVNKHNKYISSPAATMAVVARDFSESLIRIELLLNDINVKSQLAGLGSAPVSRLTIMDDPVWSSVLAKAKRGLERFTTIYAAQISTLPSTEKKKLDFELEDIILGVEAAFNAGGTTKSAQEYAAYLDTVFETLDTRFTAYSQFTMQKSLGNLVEKKSAQLNALMSQLRLIEKKLSDSEKKVALGAHAEANRLLVELKTDTASYNKGLRQQKISVIDAHIATVQRVVEALQYRDNLSGGQFMTARRPSTKTYGFGDIPLRGGRRPFVNSPDRRVRGLGNFVSTTSEEPQQRIADTLAKNLVKAEMQGRLSPKDAEVLYAQNNQLTVALYNGDHAQLEKAKANNDARIKALIKNFKERAAIPASETATGLGQLGKTYTVQPTYGQYAKTSVGVLLASGILLYTVGYVGGKIVKEAGKPKAKKVKLKWWEKKSKSPI
jgi:hypothetical protein